MTLKELLQVTDLSIKVVIEELNADMSKGREHYHAYADDLLLDLPGNVLNSRVFMLDYKIRSCTKVELHYSVINKEYQE